jgi:hypothetical protein
MLESWGILSAVVVDDAENVCGFIDMLDIVLHTLSVFPSSTSRDLYSVKANEIKDLAHIGEKFASWKLEDVLSKAL